MGSRDRRIGNVRKVAAAAAGGLLVAAGALVGVSGAVSAQELTPPSATAVADCVGETGRIVVTIIDNSPYRYNISIDGKVVAANIPDGKDGINIFTPYADGAYPVVVNWIALNDDVPPFDPPKDPVLSTTVTVDCVADVTTTAPATTAPATTAPATTLPAAAAPTAAPPATLPATGRASSSVVTLAALLTLAGGALLVARRHPRRA